jgi:glycosyltransferase involved in cell wall biosynthesis
MRVLIVNQHIEDEIGGSELQCDIIASRLTKFRHDVVYGIVNAHKETYNVGYEWVPIKRRSFWLHFGRALKSIRPDVVYWRFNKKHLLAAVLLTRYYGVKFVFNITSIPDTKRWIPIDKRVFRKPRRIVSGLKIAKALLRYTGWSLMNALNFNGFYFVDAVVCQKDDNMGKLPVKRQVIIYDSVPSNHKQFKWDKAYIVWVANLKPEKNPEKFIELAANFRKRNIDFLMIGAIHDARYDYILNKSELLNNFHYLGKRTPEEVNGIIGSSLFLVHTCDPEGFGDNFIQAWMKAKPTISLYFDPEGIITKNQIGFVSGTIQKMIEDTEKLLTNETLRNSMGKRARDFAVAQFSPELNVKKLEKLLLSVVD